MSDITLEPPTNVADADYDASLAAIRRAVREFEGCRPAELDVLAGDLDQLARMSDKLAAGRVEIAVFGEISTGKSAVINALLGEQKAAVNVRGGWTKDVWHASWSSAGYVLPGFGASELVLVDTPGLNEVDGAARGEMAHAAADQADLVLFVTDSDLNEIEYRALTELAASHKPLILVLNKSDLYRPQELEDLLAQFRGPRLAKLVSPENVVTTAADPREVEYVIESANGSTRSEWRKPAPKVEELRLRILEMLQADGKSLLALNAAMFAADKTDRMHALRVQLREAEANRVIWSFAVTKSLAVAINPVAVADVLGGMAVDATMIVTLGRIYGIPISRKNAHTLAISIAKSAGLVSVFEAVVSWASSALKALTGGLSTAISQVPQGAAAGYGSYIVGQAARFYFQHGASWGDEGAKHVVSQILANTDKKSVIEQLKDEIRGKISRNVHAESK
ncbi:MAG: GTP-binding protein [Planctomycetaceae bacterium]|nr:GTP-binding protein [Planctomycetaceae bacterium]